jgi:hypothetical protein
LVFGSSKLGVPSLEKKSSSDPELGGRGTIIGNERGFPAGLTVDELGLYRRRRPPSHLRPKDNLQPEGGSLKSVTSEYQRRFLPHPVVPAKGHFFGKKHFGEAFGASEGSTATAIAKDNRKEDDDLVNKGHRRMRPEDGLRLEGEVILRPEYYDAFIDFPRQRPKVIRPRTHVSSDNHRQLPMDLITEKNSQYVFFDVAERPRLARRPTTLRAEGDILVKVSEIHSRYVPHEGAKRSDLARRRTSLRMEGQMDKVTEQKQKYVEFPEGRRAELSKRATQLSLEGEIDTLTEKNEKYIFFHSPERPELKKRPTTLRLEGTMESVTENSDNFIAFLEAKRAEMLKRSNNLCLEGDLEYAPEYTNAFINFPRERPVTRRPLVSLRQEGEMDTTTEKRSQFKDFLSKCQRPDLARKPTNLRLEGEIESKPEYRDSYVDFPRRRPKIKKPDTCLKPERDFETTSETEARFAPFSSGDRFTTVKKPSPSLRLDGEMHTNPEYKDSFTDFPRERSVVKKPTGNLQHDHKTLLLLADEPFKRPRGPGRPPEFKLRSENRTDTNAENTSSNVNLKTVTRRPRGPLNQNGDLKDPESKVPRAQSERRYRGRPGVDSEGRAYLDSISRERTPSRRTKPEDNFKVAGSSSLAAAISSPRMSRRQNGSTRGNLGTMHGPGDYRAVSREEQASRAKAVTFELGGGRPKTSP